MAVETADDRLVFLADFGQVVTYAFLAGGSTSVTGIFYNDYQEVTAGGTMGFSLQQPRFLCRTADIPNAEEGDIITADGVQFTVVVIMPDGTGMTEMMLEAV